MLTKDNIITIDVQDSWFKKGKEYALLSWACTFNRLGKPNPYTRLQKILLGIVAEKAVEHHFSKINLPFETAGKTKWYEVDRYDIGLKNYAIDVKANFLDLNSDYITRKLAENKDFYKWLTKCHALVPLDQFNPGKNEKRKHNKNKLYVFPFIEGRFNETSGFEALVHTFWDYKWLKRAEHKDLPNLGRLNITYNGKLGESRIKIYGTKAKNKVSIEEVSLDKNITKTLTDFFQVFSIEWIGNKPSGKLIIESPTLKMKEVIQPELCFLLHKVGDKFTPLQNDWQNIALLSSKVHILGWIDETDFRVEGKKLARFHKNIEQYSETKVDNWGCLASTLQNIDTLKQI